MKSVLAFPKPVRREDPDYLRFIRRQGCLLHNQMRLLEMYLSALREGENLGAKE